MSAMLARYLKDFGVPQPVPEFLAEESGFGLPSLPEPEAAPDIEAERQAAYAEGHEAATRELEQRHAGEVEALEAAHRQETEALRARYEEETAALIAARIEEMTGSVAGAVADAAALALVPFLGRELSRKAAADLAALIAAAIADGEAGRIRVRGPEAMFRHVEVALGDKASLVEFEDGEGVDLTAEIGGSVLVTRLSAFAAGLEKVMG